MDAVRVCSLGQITSALFEVGGQYRSAACSLLRLTASSIEAASGKFIPAAKFGSHAQ